MIASRIEAPVDVLYPENGILIRRTNGFVDLAMQTAEPGTFDLRMQLQKYGKLLARGRLLPLTILKARCRSNGLVDNGSERTPASLDIALGPEQNFVLLDVKGEWSSEGPEAHIPEAMAQLRARLESPAWGQHSGRPSLCYVGGEHPSVVQFEVTTHCNLRCGYCNNRVLPQKRHTPLPEFLRILDNVDFTRVEKVDLTGLGESLLHPAFPQIVAEIRRRGVRQIGLVTNGTLATLPRCQRLLEEGLTSISVSLDSLDPARFSDARPGGKLEPITANLVALARFREAARNHFILRIKSIVLDDDPRAEAERILAFSAEHHLDRPKFSTLDPRRVATSRYQPGLGLTEWHPAELRTLSDWLKDRWAQLGGAIPTPKEQHPLPWIHPPMQEEFDVCDWVLDSAFIGGDGFCIPCCEQIGDIPRPRLGSIFDKPLARLWNEDLLYAYRLPLSLGLIPPNCQGCDEAPAGGRPLVLEQ